MVMLVVVGSDGVMVIVAVVVMIVVMALAAFPIS